MICRRIWLTVANVRQLEEPIDAVSDLGVEPPLVDVTGIEPEHVLVNGIGGQGCESRIQMDHLMRDMGFLEVVDESVEAFLD
ncbi:hypothetical protein GB937_008397 [Aspergillus fischeri]|nr:hypothetical protein GB937_008397 [Aspergillus fischeri]